MSRQVAAVSMGFFIRGSPYLQAKAVHYSYPGISPRSSEKDEIFLKNTSKHSLFTAEITKATNRHPIGDNHG
jgi:hypothetical protein